MKSIVIKCGLSMMFIGMLMADANAQRPSRKRPANNNNTTPTNPTQQNTNNNTQPSGYNPYGNIPIVYDSSGMSDTVVRKSLRRDNAYDKSSVSARTPLVYEHLRADDALLLKKFGESLIYGRR